MTTEPVDLERLRARDPHLLTTLVREMSPRMLAVIYSYARDDDHADDLLQESWVEILKRLDGFKGRGSFAGWAIKVSRNVCRMQVRAEKRARLREAAVDGIGLLVDIRRLAPDRANYNQDKPFRYSLTGAGDGSHLVGA